MEISILRLNGWMEISIMYLLFLFLNPSLSLFGLIWLIVLKVKIMFI